MNKKKILSSIIIGMMLVALTVAAVSTVSAGAACVIKGTLYIDGIEAGEGDAEVQFIFPDHTYTGLTFDSHPADPDSLNYVIDLGFDRDAEEVGDFLVLIGYNYLVPYDNQTFAVVDVSTNWELGHVDLHVIVPENDPPNTPSNPDPYDGETDVDTDANLGWDGGDPDVGDTVEYDVYFGTSNPPSMVTTVSVESYDPGSLAYETTYYWKIVARDSYDAEEPGPEWEFTTKAEEGGDGDGDGDGDGGPGGGGGPPPVTLKAPIADAVASELSTFVNTDIDFDGSGSSDPDGTIVSLEWDFGDGNTDSGEFVTHAYTETGEYTVTLTVTDNDGKTDDDTLEITISIPNRPPTDPVVEGETVGTKDTSYDYTAVSTDADNDNISYTFDWGDDSDPTVSEFLENGTMTTQSHTWTSAGKYVVSVTAFDNVTDSGATEVTVYIDAIAVDDIGYLTDDDGDGTYDTFHANDGTTTDAELQEDGTYLIDEDGDGTPDWVFDPDTGELTAYSEPEEEGLDLTLIILAIIIIIIFLAAVAYIAKGGKGKKKK